MIWYKRYAKLLKGNNHFWVEHGFQGSDNDSWSNDQSLLGSGRTPKIGMRVNEFPWKSVILICCGTILGITEHIAKSLMHIDADLLSLSNPSNSSNGSVYLLNTVQIHYTL